MWRRRFITLLIGGIVLLVAGQALAKVRLKGWYFPKPFTMSSPMSPHRFGGMETALNFTDMGTGLAFPIRSAIAPRKSPFAVDLTLPLSIGIPKDGSTKFYMGNPSISVTGAWRFMFPFGGNQRLPAAWSAGADIGLPLAGIWGANAATLLCFPMYVREYSAWLPHFVIRPKATLAVGKPIFFTMFEMGIAGLGVTMSGDTYTVLDWGVAFGSQPHEMVSITLEFGGAHALHDDSHTVFSRNPVWGALGARFYIGEKFVTGLMMRVPFTHAFADQLHALVPDAPSNESIFAFSIFVGYQVKEHPGF